MKPLTHCWIKVQTTCGQHAHALSYACFFFKLLFSYTATILGGSICVLVFTVIVPK